MSGHHLFGHSCQSIKHAIIALSIVLVWVCTCVHGKDLRTIRLIGGVDFGSIGILEDLSIAYGVNEPDLSMTFEPMTSPETISALSKESVDFGVAIQGFDQAVKQAHPNLYLVPLFLTSFVPVYRMDSVSVDVPLIFSRQTLARILTGSIKSWSDPAIVKDNPSVVLPNLAITVILETGKAAKHFIIKNALFQFNDTLFNQSSLTLSNAMDFNISKYASYKLVEMKENTLVSAVLATNGAFAIAYYSIARTLGVSVGNMINKAGSTVSVSYQSLTYAAIELGTVQAFTHTTAQVLTDASAALAWPLALFANLIIDTEESPTSCKAREVLVEFFLYVYQSDVALSLMQARGISNVPSLLLDAAGAISFLSSTVKCRGSPALPTQVIAQRTIGVSRDLSFFGSLVSAVYTDQGVEWVSQSVYDSVLVTRMVNSEVDLAIINVDGVDPEMWQAFVNTDEFLILPMGASAISWFFNPQLTDTVSLAGSNDLILDDSLVASLFAGCVNDWNNPSLLSLNPWISELTNNASSWLLKMLGCGTLSDPDAAPRGFAMASYVRRWAADPANMANPGAICANSFFADPSKMASWYLCEMNNTQRVYFAAESVLAPIVLGLRSSMSVGTVDGDKDKLYPRLLHSRNGVSTLVDADLNGILACAYGDSFDSANLRFDLDHSTNSSCWPQLQQYHLIARRQYYSSAVVTNSSLCDRGLDSLQFLYWLLSSDYANTLTQALDLGTFFRLPNIADRYNQELNSVLCDDQTLYITLPVIWSLNAGIKIVAMAAAVIGMIYTFVLIGCTVKYREQAIIRASSPVFIVLSLCGVLLLFAGVIAFVLPATLESCAAFAWFANLGVQVTFAPLIFKALRIYRIFGRRKLAVVKISNRKLLSWVAISIGIELLLLSIWQAISPEQPYTSTDIEGASGIVHVYTQCGVRGSGSSMLGLVVAYKACLLVFGCLLAFGTRKVTSKFNESSQIATGIYNLTFTSLIIGAILAMINVQGDAEVGMITFVALWVGYCTATLLVVPKLLVLWRPEAEEGGTDASSQQSTGGFSFLSIENFDSIAMITTYIAALRRHLDTAEARFQTLKKKGGKIEMQQSKIVPIESIVSARGPSSMSMSTNQLRARPVATSTIASVALASPSASALQLPNVPVKARKLSTKVECDEKEET